MLLINSDKTRKVITFDTHGKKYRVKHLLDEARVLSKNVKKISFVDDPLLLLNYVVETDEIIEETRLGVDEDSRDNVAKLNRTAKNIKSGESSSDLLSSAEMTKSKDVIVDNPKNTIVEAGSDNKVKMLTVTEDGTQTLFTIDIYDDNCTIYHLLLGIGVSMENLVKVICISSMFSSVKYIVECNNEINILENKLEIIAERKLETEKARFRAKRKIKKADNHKTVHEKFSKAENFGKFSVIEKVKILLEKKIIDPYSEIVEKQKNNIVRFLILTTNGKENLIEFEILNDKCTLQQLLNTIENIIPFEAIPIVSSIQNYPILSINYLVEFKLESHLQDHVFQP